jgi:hypothetical protein
MIVYLDSSIVLRRLLDQPRVLRDWADWEAAYSNHQPYPHYACHRRGSIEINAYGGQDARRYSSCVCGRDARTAPNGLALRDP